MPTDPTNTRPAYMTANPMPTELIGINTLVSVPLWRKGEIVKWGLARVLEIRDPEAPVYLVELSDPLPFTDAQAIYYPYSIECGICAGRPATTECLQCRPENPWFTLTFDHK